MNRSNLCVYFKRYETEELLGKNNRTELTDIEKSDIERSMVLNGVEFDRDCMNHKRYMKLQRGRRKRRRQTYFRERHESYVKVTTKTA